MWLRVKMSKYEKAQEQMLEVCERWSQELMHLLWAGVSQHTSYRTVVRERMKNWDKTEGCPNNCAHGYKTDSFSILWFPYSLYVTIYIACHREVKNEGAISSPSTQSWL